MHLCAHTDTQAMPQAKAFLSVSAGSISRREERYSVPVFTNGAGVSVCREGEYFQSDLHQFIHEMQNQPTLHLDLELFSVGHAYIIYFIASC